MACGLLLLALAGLMFRTVDLDEKVVEVRVVDVDADGQEDVVAVTKKHLYVFRGAKAPVARVDAPALVVVGRGLLGVVRDGQLFEVQDPFGEWKEKAIAVRPLLAMLGKGAPAILDAPGDLDGDGKDDPILADARGFFTPFGRVALAPETRLEIKRNEAFAVEAKIPVPVVGNWSGGGRELVFFHERTIVAYAKGKEVERVPLPLREIGKEAESIRRNHVFLRDIDGDGRLDLLLVVAKGATGIFQSFEATARHFPGGRIYDREKKGFFRPASFLKVEGALLRPSLVDLDGDGDLDLVLSTINTSVLAAATGTAPGTYWLFRFEGGKYERQPAWTLRAPVPLTAFTAKPQPPIVFFPDFDGDGRPEGMALGTHLRLFEFKSRKGVERGAQLEIERTGRPSVGRTLAAVPAAEGFVLVEKGG